MAKLAKWKEAVIELYGGYVCAKWRAKIARARSPHALLRAAMRLGETLDCYGALVGAPGVCVCSGRCRTDANVKRKQARRKLLALARKGPRAVLAAIRKLQAAKAQEAQAQGATP